MPTPLKLSDSNITISQNDNNDINIISNESVNNTSTPRLSEAEQKILNTPDSELTPEQRAVKENIRERNSSVLQSNANGGIINNNNDNISSRGDNNGSTNAELLAGGQVSTANRSGNSVRKQDENSRKLAGYLGTLEKAEGQDTSKYRAGESGWLFRQNNQEIKSSRNEESLFRTISGIEPSGQDTIGRKLSDEIKNKFKNTVFKDENGNLLSLYHWTIETFEKFAKGEFGFHFGTLDAAHDRYEQTKEEYPDTPTGNYKEVYINITNPLYIEVDAGRWCARDIAYQLAEKGIIPEQQYDRLSITEGFWDYTYDNPAAKAVRDI